MYESAISTVFRAPSTSETFYAVNGNELVVRAIVNSAAKSAFGDEHEADRILPIPCKSWNDHSYGI